MNPDGNSSEPQVISYATPSDEVRSRTLLKIARWAGWIPLYVGLGSLIGWLISRSDFFMTSGVLALYSGIIGSGVGFVCLIVYYFVNRSGTAARRLELSQEVLGTIALYICDYAAAFLCVIVVVACGGMPH